MNGTRIGIKERVLSSQIGTVFKVRSADSPGVVNSDQWLIKFKRLCRPSQMRELHDCGWLLAAVDLKSIYWPWALIMNHQADGQGCFRAH